MKLILRLLNIVIMALSVAATVFLFMPPSFSFNSKITVNVATFSAFIPETEFTKDIDVTKLLGTENIYVGLKFKLDIGGINEMKDGNKERINNNLISNNVQDIVSTLHEPVDLITDFVIRDTIKRIITQQVTNYVDQAREKYDPSHALPSTTQDIMDDVGMDDEYFTNFSYTLYDAANADGATVDSASEVLYAEIDEALAKADESGMVDTSGFDRSSMSSIKDSLVATLSDLGLVEEGGNLKKISQISYLYLADFLKEDLKGSVSEEELARGSEESIPDHADRLLGLFVTTKMPAVVYQSIGYVCLGLYIGLYVFAGIWALLFVITLIKTFTRKPWTFFGPWFWLAGIIELFLGFGITALAKFGLPHVDISSLNLPISSVLASVRTYALIPSILFLVSIVVAIVYTVIKKIAKHSII